MKQKRREKISLEHSGDHHQAKITLDPNTNKITGGAVYNFSNNSAAALTLDEKGKARGFIVHSGDTHGFRADLKSDGSFQGLYADKKRGVELVLSGDKAMLTKGKIPQVGLTINGDHHKVLLKRDAHGKISGEIKSKLTKQGKFGLAFRDGKIVGGSFTHTGKHHTTQISIVQGGWKAGISSALGKSKWAINVEKGQAGIKAFAGLKMKF